MYLVTEAQVAEIAGTIDGPIVKGFVKVLNEQGDKFGVNTWLRVCHFIAQCAEESDHFNTLHEYASGAEYEGRRDLGNIFPGDGRLFKGSGDIELTGRSNYQVAGAALGLDLINHPELVRTPEIGALVSLWFWLSHDCNQFADRDDMEGLTRRINGGFNGIEVRIAMLAKAKKVLDPRQALTQALIDRTVAVTAPPIVLPKPAAPPVDTGATPKQPQEVHPMLSFISFLPTFIKILTSLSGFAVTFASLVGTGPITTGSLINAVLGAVVGVHGATSALTQVPKAGSVPVDPSAKVV